MTPLRVRTISPFADEDAAEAKAHAERAAERMRKLHADPEFAKAHAERMRKLHADPEFAKAHAERMRKLNADPEFAKANAEAVSKAQKKRWAEWRKRRGS